MAIKEYSHYIWFSIYHSVKIVSFFFFLLELCLSSLHSKDYLWCKGLSTGKDLGRGDHLQDQELCILCIGSSTILKLAPPEHQTTVILETSKNAFCQPCSR